MHQLTELVRQFAEVRDWEQFHSPRNLLLALVGEVGELAAEFQWVSDQDVQSHFSTNQTKRALSAELADVLIYLLRLSDVVGIELDVALRDKIKENESRYPIERARSSSAKYTAYE